jgi:hypothetical protein
MRTTIDAAGRIVIPFREFVQDLPGHGVTGGAAYDAPVAVTDATCGADLVTCDKRALSVYERYGIRARLLS